jgi:hypothetical protein
MDMKQVFVEAVDAAVDIDFGPKGSEEVSMFETTIRYPGGFIAAYDVSGCQDPRLLQKAIEIGDMAYATFETPNRMFVTRWSPQKAADGHGTVTSRIRGYCRDDISKRRVHTIVATYRGYALFRRYINSQ